MPASINSIQQMAKILETELGIDKACWIARRFVEETSGNSSYTATVKRLQQVLEVSRRNHPSFTYPFSDKDKREF